MHGAVPHNSSPSQYHPNRFHGQHFKESIFTRNPWERSKRKDLRWRKMNVCNCSSIWALWLKALQKTAFFHFSYLFPNGCLLHGLMALKRNAGRQDVSWYCHHSLIAERVMLTFVPSAKCISSTIKACKILILLHLSLYCFLLIFILLLHDDQIMDLTDQKKKKVFFFHSEDNFLPWFRLNFSCLSLNPPQYHSPFL